jgi:hypothetical protein
MELGNTLPFRETGIISDFKTILLIYHRNYKIKRFENISII